MLYPIELTPPAKEAYTLIHDNAQPYLVAGQDTHPSVLTFKAVENALDAILAQNPCNPDLALSGLCSVMYRVPLGSVSIIYVVNPFKPVVIVLTISTNQPGMRKWLITAIENGTVDGLLETLEIEKPGINVEVNERWTH
jgi:hypothetical protein